MCLRFTLQETFQDAPYYCSRCFIIIYLSFLRRKFDLYLRFSPEVLCSSIIFHVSGIVCPKMSSATYSILFPPCFICKISLFHTFSWVCLKFQNPTLQIPPKELMVLICFSMFLPLSHGFLGHELVSRSLQPSLQTGFQIGRKTQENPWKIPMRSTEKTSKCRAKPLNGG